MTVHPIHGMAGPALPTATPAATGSGGATASPHVAADLVEVSAGAALLRRLAALASESPARFQAVTTAVAARLAAQAAADPQRAGPLARLAERFAAAAQAGTPAPLAAEAGPHAPAAPLAGAAGNAGPSPATLAAAALVAGAQVQRPPARIVRRAYPRAGAARPGGPGDGRDEQAGGILGALLASVAGVVEAALDAALLDAPGPDAGQAPEGEPAPPGSSRPGPR